MDIQHFERLLARYERLAGRSEKLKRLERQHQETLRCLIAAQEGNRRRDRDMDAALAKIEEWRSLYATLRDRLSPKQRAALPGIPKPLEVEMPF